MTDEDRKLLEDDGWTVDCESPFELSDRDGNRATGRAAQYVLEFLKCPRVIARPEGSDYLPF